jgi:hypothetical protein
MVGVDTSKKLAAEGSSMHHCVYSYRADIEKGKTSIWSFRLNGDRVATIEIRLPEKIIVQARGHCNRVLEPVEKRALKQFAIARGIRLGNYW